MDFSWYHHWEADVEVKLGMQHTREKKVGEARLGREAVRLPHPSYRVSGSPVERFGAKVAHYRSPTLGLSR